jgi:FkbM family methyltransferase
LGKNPNKEKKYNPTWHTIRSGILKGKRIYLDPRDGFWQTEMLNGTYDDFFFTYLKSFNLKGATIYDIGSHIGYHLMCYSVLVGDKGTVIGFEPNPYNIQRINKNISKNNCFHNITIKNFAVSDTSGRCEFSFSKEVDNGFSSGSHINRASTPSDKQLYHNIGFEKINVKTTSLDEFIHLNTIPKPDLIKMDIEGAEYLALRGMANLLKTKKPTLLIEIHSIFNMHQANKLLDSVEYNIELLKEETDGRCFICAKSK